MYLIFLLMRSSILLTAVFRDGLLQGSRMIVLWFMVLIVLLSSIYGMVEFTGDAVFTGSLHIEFADVFFLFLLF